MMFDVAIRNDTVIGGYNVVFTITLHYDSPDEIAELMLGINKLIENGKVKA